MASERLSTGFAETAAGELLALPTLDELVERLKTRGGGGGGGGGMEEREESSPAGGGGGNKFCSKDAIWAEGKNRRKCRKEEGWMRREV